MDKSQLIIILKGLLLAKGSGECDAIETQKLINHFEKLFREISE